MKEYKQDDKNEKKKENIEKKNTPFDKSRKY